MRLRPLRLNWFDCLIIAIGLVVLAGMLSVWYVYRWPHVYKFSCQIERTKANEPCHFVLDGSNFVAPIQAYVMWPAVTAQSLARVQLTKTELGATSFVSFWQGDRLIGKYRIEDTNAMMALVARSGFAILTADKLHMQKDFSFKKEIEFKVKCKAQLGEELKCEETK